MLAPPFLDLLLRCQIYPRKGAFWLAASSYDEGAMHHAGQALEGFKVAQAQEAALCLGFKV